MVRPKKTLPLWKKRHCLYWGSNPGHTVRSPASYHLATGAAVSEWIQFKAKWRFDTPTAVSLFTSDLGEWILRPLATGFGWDPPAHGHHLGMAWTKAPHSSATHFIIDNPAIFTLYVYSIDNYNGCTLIWQILAGVEVLTFSQKYIHNSLNNGSSIFKIKKFSSIWERNV